MHPRKRQQRKNESVWKMVGAMVAHFREAAGLNQRQLAAKVNLHVETIASIEQGRRPLKPDLAKVLDRVLETKEALETAVENVPEDLLTPVRTEQFMDLESEAIMLSWFENQVLPGLLQPENYARAVFHNRIPVFSQDEINALVATRLARQKVLHREEPPTASFVISEAVVRDRLGGDEVYAEMLRHVRACADLPAVTIQIMPFGRQTHPALCGPFILLETPDHQHLAYAEIQRSNYLIRDPKEVSILAKKYAMLRTQALNPDDSKDLLERLLGEL
ncbi:helix-turn-helix transcriptional regulator [Streptomyces sp. NPDC051907]|uniref:helix-turn-helix domain-containing protein n=1 Tax=Streptomyces sp. NPDC051907 TaxID=3155284 RepID=UPI003418BEB9